MKNNRGVTLVALVITIIVLLILAGVSLAMLTGENGILTNASNAKTETAKANFNSGVDMTYMELKTESFADATKMNSTLMTTVAGHYFTTSEATTSVEELKEDETDTTKVTGYKLTITSKDTVNLPSAATITYTISGNKLEVSNPNKVVEDGSDA